jgi:hypothetical protein
MQSREACQSWLCFAAELSDHSCAPLPAPADLGERKLTASRVVGSTNQSEAKCADPLIRVLFECACSVRLSRPKAAGARASALGMGTARGAEPPTWRGLAPPSVSLVLSWAGS